MYHDVVAAGAEDRSGFPGRDAALYKITIARFEAHLAALAALKRGATNPPAAVKGHAPRAQAFRPALTFDDGGVSAIEAADLLERYGFSGKFFVTTNYIGAPGFLTAAHIRELNARGHAVGSHSCSHPLRMGHCSSTRLAEEWSRSCAILGDILGVRVSVASVPGGDFSAVVAETAAAAGITDLFTSEPTAAVRRTHGLSLRGRFTIHRWTGAAVAAGLVQGDWLPRANQAFTWNAKKVSKRVAGAHYLTLRRLLLGHGGEVRWGDL